jgi:LmbE family N-acetylglucosaminyl deacetylase
MSRTIATEPPPRRPAGNLSVRAVARSAALPFRRAHAGLLRRWFIRRGARADVLACPTVIVAPHQDDETIGCGGLIALKRRAGADVTVVILTDGSNYRGRDAAASTAQVTALRRQEALAATAALGVPADRVRFLDGPDGQLATLHTEARAALVRQLAAILTAAAPEEAYVTHRHDGHPDHEAAHGLLCDALAQIGCTARVWQYPIWMTWVAPIGLRLKSADLAGLRIVPVTAVSDAKAKALAAYPSQLATLPSHFLDPFALPYEVYFSDNNF